MKNIAFLFLAFFFAFISLESQAESQRKTASAKIKQLALISDVELLALSEEDLLRIISDRLADGANMVPEMAEATQASGCNGGIGSCSGACSSIGRSIVAFWPWGEDCVEHSGTCRRSYNPFYEFLSCLCNITTVTMVPCPEGI